MDHTNQEKICDFSPFTKKYSSQDYQRALTSQMPKPKGLFSIVNWSAALETNNLAFLLVTVSSLGFHLRSSPFSLFFTCPFSSSQLLNFEGPKAQYLYLFPSYSHSFANLIQSSGSKQQFISSNSQICISRLLP